MPQTANPPEQAAPTYTMTWFDNAQIAPEHADLPVRQVYGFFTTEDEMVAVVSKDGERWQFPGGSPHKNRSAAATLEREAYEEAGVRVSRSQLQRMIGYYVVEEVLDGAVAATYLQLRIHVPMPMRSSEVPLEPHEPQAEINRGKAIRFAEWFPLADLPDRFPWFDPRRDEYAALLASVATEAAV